MNIQQAMINIAARIPVNDPTVQARLDRAYDICISQGYTLQQNADKSWSIYRASTSLLEDSSAQYTVSAEHGCTCPDADPVSGRARAGLCKHRLAVMVKEEMARYTETELLDMSLTHFSMLCRDMGIPWLNRLRSVVVRDVLAKQEV